MKERKKIWESLCNAECRSFDSPQKTSPWLHHPSSSSFFFNGVFESEGESNIWILPLYKARCIPLLKPKQQLKAHKCAGNRKATKKTKEPSVGGTHGHAPLDARICVPHHDPWWPPWSDRGELCPVWSRCFLNDVFWPTFGPRNLPWIFLFWAYWACFSTLFTWLGINSHIYPKAWPESC